MRSKRTDSLVALCWLAAGAAVTTNTIEAFGGIDAGWWRATRLLLSAVFTVALVAVVLSKVVDRYRSRGSR